MLSCLHRHIVHQTAEHSTYCIVEDMRNEAARMKAVQIARLMLDGGKLSYEDIAAYTELTIEEVEKSAFWTEWIPETHKQMRPEYGSYNVSVLRLQYSYGGIFVNSRAEKNRR